MKTNCDIIRDLLPLYAEHITSEATNALVEEHLAECEACRAELEQMEQPVPVRPEAQPDAPLRRIRAALQRRSFRAAIGSVLAALCALAMIFWMGTARVPATTEQAHFWTYNRTVICGLPQLKVPSISSQTPSPCTSRMQMSAPFSLRL